eukprot:148994-Hanusia_phi.AAC.1
MASPGRAPPAGPGRALAAEAPSPPGDSRSPGRARPDHHSCSSRRSFPSSLAGRRRARYSTGPGASPNVRRPRLESAPGLISDNTQYHAARPSVTNRMILSSTTEMSGHDSGVRSDQGGK